MTQTEIIAAPRSGERHIRHADFARIERHFGARKRRNVMRAECFYLIAVPVLRRSRAKFLSPNARGEVRLDECIVGRRSTHDSLEIAATVTPSTWKPAVQGTRADIVASLAAAMDNRMSGVCYPDMQALRDGKQP